MRKLENFLFSASYEEAKEFGRNQNNRPIKQNHVDEFKNELKKSNIKDGELSFGVVPIVVNEITNHILDGQHRHLSFIQSIEEGILPKGAEIAVLLVKFTEDEELDKIIKYNEKSKNWSLNDFIGLYSYLHNMNYIKLIKFAKSHELCKSKTDFSNEIEFDKYGWPILNGLKMRYATALIKLKKCDKMQKRGEFTASEDELQRAETINNEIVEILKYIYDNEYVVNANVEPMIFDWAERRNNTTLSHVRKNLNKNNEYLKKEIVRGGKGARTAWIAAFDPKY